MKVLLDMNLSPQLCGALHEQGIDSVHWSEVGDPRAADRTVAEWARREGRVLVTHDLDFGALLAATQLVGPSVIQVRTQDVMPAAFAPLLARVLKEHADSIRRGAIVTVNETEARVRILPLEPIPPLE